MSAHHAIKMVFVDLDGTLLNESGEVTARTQEAFRRVRESGVIPVVCTGRVAYEADFAANAIGAEGYLISSNGLVVYRNYQKQDLLYEEAFSEEQSDALIDILMEEGVFFEAYAGNRARAPKERAALIDNCGWSPDLASFFGSHMLTVENLKRHLSGERLRVNKFIVCTKVQETLDQISERCRRLSVTPVSSGYTLEILPKDADKRRAVRAIAAIEGLSREKIMVIGDSDNDAGMFEEANICVAMGNACPQLKAKANYYAPDNDSDGVAWALENLLLSEHPSVPQGHIERISGADIERAMQNSTRQYFTGDLKLPQILRHLFDANVESGVSAYPNYKWEAPHYHTTETEYCYILEGETKYVNLSNGKEFRFVPGDFYVLHRHTPYLQKCKPGCRLLFFKIPGGNDKVLVPITNKMREWCADWDNMWNALS